ncbi:hypothetical protein FA13DRAFT_314142 [Coprinellus micaceus]|uniref:Uncharacterized protein n=1 Tax=Coprinellus micaceus TaxID=71717 RepID=A0A4Y7TCK2_COPMI|nr:hypothetical protein FA13DRAFT_314142 [Coprinellus micaceus]
MYLLPPSHSGSPRTSFVPSPAIIHSPPATVASTLNSRRTTMTSAYPTIEFHDEESVPPTPSSITSFASSNASSQILLRTSRSVSNLSTVAASPLDDSFPSLSPASPSFPASPPANRPSFSSAISGGSGASLPPPPVPPKDDGYNPNEDMHMPNGHGRKESKGAVAGGVYVPGYEWPPSAPLPASAFVPDSTLQAPGVSFKGGDEERKEGGMLGRLRLKSSPSLGNLHGAREKEKEKERSGLRGFAARMGMGRT